METINLDHFVYLLVLGGLLAFFVIGRGRVPLRRAGGHLAVWALLIFGATIAAGVWGEIRGFGTPQQAVFSEAGRIELPRAPDGHYYATLDVNGTPVRFVVDTGATGMVLTRRDAARVGIRPETLMFLGEARTANGIVRTAPVTLDSVALGPFQDRAVRAYVNGGEMTGSLLGMDYLGRFERIEIAEGRLVLER